jgi:hypothetical protein
MIVGSMNEGESETEHDRKVREFWSKANKDRIKLQYEPTAVLAKPNSNNKKPIKLRDILDLDLTRL